MKPTSFWIGKSTEDVEGTTVKPSFSNLWGYLTLMTGFVMDDCWVPLSRNCAYLIDSPYRLWTVVLFASFTICILAIQVSKHFCYMIRLFLN